MPKDGINHSCGKDGINHSMSSAVAKNTGALSFFLKNLGCGKDLVMRSGYSFCMSLLYMASINFQGFQRISLTETEAGPKGRPKQAFGPSPWLEKAQI